MENTYLIHRTDIHGAPSRRYWKLIYTAALRLGEDVRADEVIRISFNGDEFPTPAHEQAKHDQHNERFLGTLFLNNKSFQNIVFVHTTKFSRLKWVTFWPNSEDERAAEGTVEPLIKLALEGVPLSASEVVAEMHPEYIKNPGIDPTVLLARAKNLAETDAAQLLKTAEIWRDTAKANDERTKILLEENANLEDENKRLLEENERLKKEKMAASDRGNVVVENQAKKLVFVEENVLIYGSSNTVLHFDDGTKKSMKTSTFDKDLSVTNKAKKLVDRMVTTTCWDPVNEPGKWSRLGYFRNVYEAD